MNRRSYNNLFRVFTLLFFFVISSQICVAIEEVPLLPMTVQGIALVDGTPTPVGTVVAAYLNGGQVGNFSVSSSSGEYCFWIPGTAADEGKIVRFTVNGKDTGKVLTWESGKQVLSFQLSVGKGINSEDYVGSLSSVISSESLTKNEKPNVSGKISETKIIESTMPEPDVDYLKSINISSLGEETAKAAEESTKQKNAPGFSSVYMVAGLIMLVFGFNLVRRND